MRLLVVFISILSLSAFWQKSYSWGDEGHSITALMAESILNEQSQKGDIEATEALKVVRQILGSTTINEAAVWPDKVKSLSRECNSKPYIKDPTYGKPGSLGQSSAICDAYKFTSSWHFINADGHYTPNPLDPGYFKGDMAVLINGLTHVLKNESAPILTGVHSFTSWKTECLKKENHECKKEALEFLIHLVGDAHQPLHSGANCDIGGNAQFITFFGEAKDPAAFWCKATSPESCNNHELHQAWDTSMLVYSPNHDTFSIPLYVLKLTSVMKNKVSSSDPKKCVSVSPNTAVDVDKSNGPEAWVNESLCYMDQVYNFSDDSSAAKSSTLDNRCRADKKVVEGGRVSFSAFAVGESYYQTNLVTINERLYWGGNRLATILKSIYGNGDKITELQ